MFNDQLEMWRFGIKFKPVKELLKIASAEGAIQAKLPPPPAPAAVQPPKPPAVKPGLSSHISGKPTASGEGVAAGNSPYASVISPPKPNNTSYISTQAPPAPTAPPRPVTPPVTPSRPAAAPVQTPVPQNTQPTKPVSAPNAQNIQTSAAPQIPSITPQPQQSSGIPQGLPAGTRDLGGGMYDVPGIGKFNLNTGQLVGSQMSVSPTRQLTENYQQAALRNAGQSTALDLDNNKKRIQAIGYAYRP